MKHDIQRQILEALLIALRPLARALLRAGIGYREFAEISKTAFVDIATKDYGLRGRPTNISRVAVMTGLTRKEVRRLRDKSDSGEGTLVLRSTPMAEILHRWYTDAEFLNGDGQPKVLGFSGDSASFSSLVRKHGGDIPPGAMRTELKRIGAVEELSSGKLSVLMRHVTGQSAHEKLVTGLAKNLYPAALAFAHNTESDESKGAWVCRTAATNHVRGSDISRLRRITSDRLAEFVESIDDLFVAYETLYEGDESSESEKAVGVGVFYFEEDKGETDLFQ